jgi:hypothetical protein
MMKQKVKKSVRAIDSVVSLGKEGRRLRQATPFTAPTCTALPWNDTASAAWEAALTLSTMSGTILLSSKPALQDADAELVKAENSQGRRLVSGVGGGVGRIASGRTYWLWGRSLVP